MNAEQVLRAIEFGDTLPHEFARSEIDAYQLFIQCGKVCELALIEAAECDHLGLLDWAAYHYDRAETRAEMAHFIASGGRHA